MSIVLETITKRYGNASVVDSVSLNIAEGECFVLLGPSGSGKSTILRMIAGLTPVDGGKIVLHNNDATGLLPQQREIGFVFQNYALFQHMTVAENIEFGLRVRHVPRAERQRRRDELLELVDLAGLGGRLPRQLSGGQQQRVALARALAPNPSILLLDEPFGALDAQIRAELRASLRRIQRELAITTIFVTHDQEEAFELADRLGIMRAGKLLEVGTPRDLYLAPQRAFTATFLGSANVWLGDLHQRAAQLGPISVPLTSEVAPTRVGQSAQVLFRPEDVTLASNESALSGTSLGQGIIERVTFAGTLERVRVGLTPIAGVRPLTPVPLDGEQVIPITVARTQQQSQAFPLSVGDMVWVGVQRIHPLLDAEIDRAALYTEGGNDRIPAFAGA